MSTDNDHMTAEPNRYHQEVRPAREWMHASDVDWIIGRCRNEIRQRRLDPIGAVDLGRVLAANNLGLHVTGDTDTRSFPVRLEAAAQMLLKLNTGDPS